MKFPFSLRFLLVAAIVIATTLAVYSIYFTSPQGTDFLFQVAQKQDIEVSLVSTGQLEPKRHVEVGAQVSGQVEKIYVEEGDEVEEGQLLVAIDARVFDTQVQKAQADLDSKKAQLEQLRAERELAEVRAKRNANLFEQNAVSQDVVVSSNTNLKVIDTKISASIAQIKADQASLEGDITKLGFAKIYAPISGTIASLKVREGQTLNANQNAPLLLQISDLSVMTLRAEVSEADVQKITRGMPVYFSTLGDNKTFYHSTVRQVLPTPTVLNDVVLYQVLIDIDNTERTLMDAMTTQVFFVQAQEKNALSVPLAAVKGGNQKTFVLLKQGDDTVRTMVKVGIKNRTHIQILEGLSEGDQVVVGLADGSATSATTTRKIPGGQPAEGPPRRRDGF
ncbi:efflux RND transporter periplasmic adaptor subunit [Alteromonas sp. D210916BOD_24]|uniref:efflux RND transporter periplasmic adaptor subunit n=1 Tax=Alteromonas sp. D210916BOD_24 TaxID=3157618 RepID=UPI00399C649A